MIRQSVNSDLMNTLGLIIIIYHSSSFIIFEQRSKVLNDGLPSFTDYAVFLLAGPPDERNELDFYERRVITDSMRVGSIGKSGFRS